MRALGQLAAVGDARAARDAAALALDLARSDDHTDRRAVAVAVVSREFVDVDPGVLVALLDDTDVSVRAAALDAVIVEDADDPEVVTRVIAAVGDARTTGRATAAVRRLGDGAAPYLRAALAREDAPRRASLVRAAAAAATEHGVGIVALALDDPDRTVALAALDALDAAGHGDLVPPEALDGVLRDAGGLVARALAARAVLAEQNGALVRALDDEIDLARRLVIAVLALRHGRRIREAVRVAEHGEGARRALGVEALDVLLTRDEAALALPLVRRDLSPDEQAVAMQSQAPSTRSAEEWIADIAADPEGVWRSSWLAACARHASPAEHA